MLKANTRCTPHDVKSSFFKHVSLKTVLITWSSVHGHVPEVTSLNDFYRQSPSRTIVSQTE